MVTGVVIGGHVDDAGDVGHRVVALSSSDDAGDGGEGALVVSVGKVYVLH